MKNIKILNGNINESFFKIGGYSFLEIDSNLFPLAVYRIIIKKKFSGALYVRYWLEEIIGEESKEIKFLKSTPGELVNYIKKYEIGIPFREIYLFHEIKTKYIDFLLYDTDKIKNNIILIGFNLFESETHLAIKAFTLEGLLLFTEKFFKYCEKEKIFLENMKNLKWIQLENYILPDQKLKHNFLCESFLDKTLDERFFSIFIGLFQEFDERGYISKKSLEKEIELKKGKPIKIKSIDRIIRFFSISSKFTINDSSKKILYLHDTLLNKEDETVYVLNSHIIQYYQLYWFEDFCTKVLENMSTSEFKITNIYSGRKFNFFSNKNNECEIDIIFEVRKQDIYKIIAIECKKTLTESKLRETSRKVKEKILESDKRIIDAYISIGCFSDNKINFDKIKNNKNYREGKIHSEKSKLEDIPYFAFSISSRKDLEDKIITLMKEIFEKY